MTADKVAVFLVNFNMRERADALCEAIVKNVKWNYDLFVIDNGSDVIEPPWWSNVILLENVQTTGGWLAGLDAAHLNGSYFAYWFLITSAEYVGDSDILSPMVQYLIDNEKAAGIHPALAPGSTSDWPHLFDTGGGGVRETWHIDNIASLYRASWFDEVGGFNKDMSYAWGIDLELCYKARRQKRGLYVHEGDGVRIKKDTDIAYRMERMNMTADERRQRAGTEMSEVLSAKYGADYWRTLTGDHITEDMLMSGENRQRERVSCAL